MKKRIILLLALMILITINIFSIGFEFHAFDIRTDMEFSKGVFPTSLLYQFDFPVPDFIHNQSTDVDFRMDNGIDFRTLRQQPETGELLLENPVSHPTDYITLYDEMNIVLGQGFFKTPWSIKDTLKLWTTIDVRFENAYEGFNYLRNPEETEGLFIKNPYYDGDQAIQRYSTWIGQPELTGDRSTTNITISIGLDLNFMQDKITRRNGISNSTWVRLNPKWFDAFHDETQDYILVWNKLDLAYTPFAITMQGSRDTTWFSMVIENSTTYRYITGTKIPYYIQGGYIMGTQALNTEHVLTNRTALTLYGPQINSYDCYPFITTFMDVGLSFGKLLNNPTQKTYFDTVTSIGLKAEFVIFNIASFYYEIGYVMNNTLETEGKTIMQIGFSFGV